MPGSDFLALDPTQAPSGRLTAWLADELRTAISDGRLGIGDRLPSARDLSADLKVSRGVVTEAYQRLVDDGRIAGRRGAGTVVVSAPQPAPASIRPPLVRAPGVAGTLHPGIAVEFDLSPGLPDLTAFPRAAWSRAERSALDTMTARQWGYPDAQGSRELREALAAWLRRTRGMDAEPERIVIVAGVAQALALLATTLQEQGTTSMAVEDPGSLGARDQLQSWGMATPPVPVDDAGLIVSELASSGSPAVLVTPAHEFPFGVVLSPVRRNELLAWSAAEPGRLIIEDDYDAEHRYDRPPVPALAGLAPDRVVYTGSVSKFLAPAIRIGWLVPPERLVDALVDRKRHSDLGNPALAQLTLTAMMSDGTLERHLRAIRRRHRERRDAMAAALTQLIPSARLHGIAAGLHLTVTLPDAVDDRALAEAALGRGGARPATGLASPAARPAGTGAGLCGQPPRGHSDGGRPAGRPALSRPQVDAERSNNGGHTALIAPVRVRTPSLA